MKIIGSFNKKQANYFVVLIVMCLFLIFDLSRFFKVYAGFVDALVMLAMLIFIVAIARSSSSSIKYEEIDQVFLSKKNIELGDERYKKLLKSMIVNLEAIIISGAERGLPRNTVIEEKLALLQNERNKFE